MPNWIGYENDAHEMHALTELNREKERKHVLEVRYPKMRMEIAEAAGKGLFMTEMSLTPVEAEVLRENGFFVEKHPSKTRLFSTYGVSWKIPKDEAKEDSE